MLIDKEELLANVQADIDLQITGIENVEPVIRCLQTVLDDIKESPAVEAVPVRHGRWVQWGVHEDIFECTSCGEPFVPIEGTPADNGYHYCPNCGARMDEE